MILSQNNPFAALWTTHVSARIESLLLIAAAILVALLIHAILRRILQRVVVRTSIKSDDLLIRRGIRPARWLLIGVALSFVRPILTLGPRLDAIWSQLSGMVVPALIGWLAIAMVGAMQDIIFLHADLSVADNLRARQQRTRSTILARIAVVLIIFVVLCLMLLSIPAVRTVGVTLMASAGLMGLAVGAAAQPFLKNIIAGIQLALTEPIRIDDVVIVENEWGRIEDIHLTYVVVAIWDQRRLVVPISKFIESSFQNWTRSSSELLGTVYFYLDPRTDVDRLRAAFADLAKASPLWDGRAQGVQVTDVKPEAIEVRGLASAANSSDVWDLRCYLREKLLAYIRTEMPEAMPRQRALLARDLAGGGVDPTADEPAQSAG